MRLDREQKRGRVVSIKEELISEIENAPEALVSRLLDYLHLLKSEASREKLEIMLLAESSFSKDWLKPEEDEAWRDL